MSTFIGTTLRSGHIVQDHSSLSSKHSEENIKKQQVIISNLMIDINRVDKQIQSLQDINDTFNLKKEKYVAEYCSLLKLNFTKHYTDCKELSKQKKTLRPSEYKSNLKNLKKSYKILYKLENKNFKNMMPKENSKELKKRKENLDMKFYEKNYYFDEVRLANEAIQMYEFIDITQSSIKNQKKKHTSVLDLQKVSNLPTDLILFIRDFIPYEVRVSLMQDKFNVYSFIKPHCSELVDIVKSIIDSPNFYTHFHLHPIYKLMSDRITDRITFTTIRLLCFSLNRRKQYTLCNYLRFKTLVLLFKTLHPKFAFKIIKTLKNIKKNYPDTLANNLHLLI